MKKISIIILLIICLSSILLTGCEEVGITPEINSGNSEYQGDTSNTGTVDTGGTVATEGAGTEDTGGTVATEGAGTGDVDTAKPVITGSRAPLPNSFGWNNTGVTVSFSCADTGPVQSGIKKNTVAGKTLTTEGKDQSVTNTGVCIDAAGNTADPVTISNINIDKTPPEVTITLPGTGEYVLNQSITATWSATDALSGVVSPVLGTVLIDISSVGTKTFILPAGTAMDKAGNSSLKVTKSYSVIADTEEPEIPDTETTGTVYPQMYATGSGTEADPWAGNCIEDAYAACPAGGTIFLRAGYYQLAGALGITKAINIIGEGMGKTFVVTANANGFFINNTNYVTIKNLTIDGTAQGGYPPYLVCISNSNSNYTVLENIEAKEAGMAGIDSSKSNHSTFKNIYSHDNNEHGVHTGGDTATGRNMYNSYRDIYVWNNASFGFYDLGMAGSSHEYCYNVFDNLNAWDNTVEGIEIAYQKGGVLSNSSSNGNGGRGIKLYYLDDFNVHDCLATLNGTHGVTVESTNNVNLTNVIAKNNNVSDTANCSGMYLGTSSGIRLTSCQSYDDRETPLQYWGLLAGSNSSIELANCKLTPNKTADIYAYSGAVVTVITEKMLAKF